MTEEIIEENAKQNFYEVVKRNEEILLEIEKLTEENRQLAARNLLGGKSEAGQTAPEPKKRTNAEILKDVMGYK